MRWDDMRAVIASIAVVGAVCGTAAFAQPAPTGDDTPDEIAKDAQRDLKDSRFYNKPGATRAQYDADWQECRLIARGSKSIDGNSTYYNPAMFNPSISPIAAGIGGGIGAAIGAAIAEGVQRRENRKRCLMIKGWRMVKLPGDRAAAVAAMSDADKQAYFTRVISAEKVEGDVETLDRFNPPEDPGLAVSVDVVGAPTLFIHKKAEKAVLPALEPGQGAIVLAFRRDGGASAGRAGLVQLFRYDRTKGDLFYQPRDWKKTGDKTSYSVSIPSGDRKAGYELRVIPVTAGDYVLGGATIGMTTLPTITNCFGAPMMRVEAGQYAYLGDASPFLNARLASGEKKTTMIFTRHFDAARKAMTGLRPDIAAKMVEPAIHNRATYACAAVTMDRFDWPGMSDLTQAVPPAASASGS